MRESDDRGRLFNRYAFLLSLPFHSISLVLTRLFVSSTWLLNTTVESLPDSSAIYESLVIYRLSHSLGTAENAWLFT